MGEVLNFELVNEQPMTLGGFEFPVKVEENKIQQEDTDPSGKIIDRMNTIIFKNYPIIEKEYHQTPD